MAKSAGINDNGKNAKRLTLNPERLRKGEKTMTNGMNYQWKLVAFACVLVVLTGIASVIAADAEPCETRILKKLLGALEVNDYDSFVADGNAAFKIGLTKQMLEGVSIQLSPRMKKGYDTTYLGQLKQQGGQVYLWKLVYKDGGDDTLAKLVLKDGKVAGFWLQ